jgi:hypothetical protein
MACPWVRRWSPNVAVGERGCIEFGRLAGFPMVEPQAGHHLLGHLTLSTQLFKLQGKFGSRSPVNEERLHRTRVHRGYDFGPCIKAKWPP